MASLLRQTGQIDNEIHDETEHIGEEQWYI